MQRYRTAGLFVGLAAVWGTAFPVTKVGLSYLPPALFAAVRFDLAAAILFAYVALSGRAWRPRGAGDWAPILTGGGLTIGAHHALLFAGQRAVPSAVAAVLLGLIPVITPALTRVVSPSERLSPVGLAGVALGFAGVVVIADPNPARLSAGDLRGVGLVLASAVAFAAGAVLTNETDPSLSLVSAQAWMMLVGAATLHAMSYLLPSESLAAATWTPSAVAALLYLTVVAGVGGFLTYFHLLDRLGPIEMGLIEYVVPLFAALTGWIVLGETPDGATAAGFCLILAGFALVKRRELRRGLRRLAGPSPDRGG